MTFDDSGQSQWRGGVGGHGNSYLRSLLVEAAQAILRCSKNALAQWGKKLLARKGQINLAVAAGPAGFMATLDSSPFPH
jgi:transposase